MTLKELGDGVPMVGHDPTIVFVMGPTCGGKSTFLAAAKERYGEQVGLVEVGKAFRDRYPPDYFKGQASPEHTRAEAIRLYLELTSEQLKQDGIKCVLVDGQPRSADQVWAVLDSFAECHKYFLYFDAPVLVRKQRAMGRFRPDSDELDLALQRLNNDRLSYYDTFVALLRRRRDISVIDTDRHKTDWLEQAFNLLEVFGGLRTSSPC